MSADVLSGVGLLIVVALTAAAYLIRVMVKGHILSPRVQKQDSSVLLGRTAMEGAHWSLLPLANFLVSVKVSANQISWSSVIFGAVAGVCMAKGHFGLGSLAAVVAGFADVLDGMVARLNGT